MVSPENMVEVRQSLLVMAMDGSLYCDEDITPGNDEVRPQAVSEHGDSKQSVFQIYEYVDQTPKIHECGSDTLVYVGAGNRDSSITTKAILPQVEAKMVE